MKGIIFVGGSGTRLYIPLQKRPVSIWWPMNKRV